MRKWGDMAVVSYLEEYVREYRGRGLPEMYDAEIASSQGTTKAAPEAEEREQPAHKGGGRDQIYLQRIWPCRSSSRSSNPECVGGDLRRAFRGRRAVWPSNPQCYCDSIPRPRKRRTNVTARSSDQPCRRLARQTRE